MSLTRYSSLMSGKTIGIWLVVIVVVGLGAYFIFNRSIVAPTPQQQQTPTATSTEQVQGQDVSVGTGAVAAPGTVVSVLYVGKLADGTVFDSSAAHGNQPLVFTLGQQGLIAGFQIGVNGMKEGGERLIAVPPALGYGAQEVKDPTTGKVIVPANSTLLFDVKLVKVETATSSATITAPTAPKK
ncbi:MAG: Peptidyl-prolyl cis-trans isomerase [Candidatus Kaiserbacteria bacterium GW2011_GWB1_52_6]|uniref:Peptidyl-prolyl cis-trans isomerase n=3 Tax=Candidatus Kaiseribacteriota TaxID=1752734 RepID=A0A0G1ZTP3_9BACT|nr:MAG: Peptidyl-prolyl cis-trans isomerase [Candidatus Kaiserbacteria bacterium GW2011_GWA2_52_12]KKW27625.1 MAG: Peptidyl-prolyl cis-trans isomerase [Candidatus Kaiserbacteria bacterium GW2011_GWB1_52_6]KKW31657.1 MAG: Peptidyl-prolyl cis-trans isomerase [Candidatus Kaiserbacteria bacterium GW2011_GWC2_52_8b]